MVQVSEERSQSGFPVSDTKKHFIIFKFLDENFVDIFGMFFLEKIKKMWVILKCTSFCIWSADEYWNS